MRSKRKAGIILPLLMAGLALGFATSFCAHVAAILGFAIIREPVVILLHLGMLVLGVAAFTVTDASVRRSGVRNEEYWKQCYPTGLRWGTGLLFAYSFISTLVMITLKFRGYVTEDETADRALAIQAFSGGWIFLYGFLLSLLVAVHRFERLPFLVCRRGHRVFDQEEKCPVCGSGFSAETGDAGPRD